MLILKARGLFKLLFLISVLLLTIQAAIAQTPAPTPRANPAVRDATRQPGAETQNPTSAPGTQQPPPQAPPGIQQPPAQAPPGSPNVTPQTQPGTPVITPQTPADLSSPTTDTSTTQEPPQPVFPTVDQKPLPPIPNMTRLGVTSDNTLTLSLNEAVKRALENNNDIEIARDDVRFAETQLRSLEGVYDPLLSFTPQIDKRISPQQSRFAGSTTAGTIATTTTSMNPAISKFFSTGGGSYELSFINSKTITNSTASIFNPVYSGNLGLTFSQPLWRNRSIDNNRRQIRIQKKRLEQSDADFRLRTIEVISRVQQAYWELVFALRDQQNQLANLNLSRENLRRVEAQIAVGTKAPLERAEVQTELANRESSLLVSVQNVSIAENNLKQLIVKDSTAPEWSAQLTPTDTPKFDAAPVNLNDALKEARDNRPELRRLRLQNDINGIDIQYFKNQTRPQVDIQATLATTGLAGTPLPRFDPDTGDPILPPENLIGGNSRMLGNLVGFGTRNVVVGVAISLPLRNRTAKANLAGVQIQREQLEASMRLQDQIIEVDVRNAAQAVETSRRRVLAAREARANAELQLEGEQRLYQVGRSTTFILFQRENALTNARNAELRAETDYNKALADLQRATSTTLRANNIVVDMPTP
ncbi:MAG: TolC family protein [Pyrinomonadaceae bacterium]